MVLCFVGLGLVTSGFWVHLAWARECFSILEEVLDHPVEGQGLVIVVGRNLCCSLGFVEGEKQQDF